MEPGAGTRLVALLGDPVEHSLSPRFQNAAFRDSGLDAVYLALRCDQTTMPGLLRGIVAGRGAGNLTIPHKAAAVPLLDRITDAVRATGACNTFWGADGRVHGDNTDVEGFGAACRALIGSPAGARVLILGAGGAARAAVAALLGARADGIHVLNRSASRAESLAEALDRSGRRVRVLEGEAELGREGYDLVVNATPLGIRPGDPLPLDLETPVRVGAALDMVYAAGGTAWTAAAERLGIPAADGTEMLLQQGAASFRRWFDRDPPLDVMRAALGRPPSHSR